MVRKARPSSYIVSQRAGSTIVYLWMRIDVVTRRQAMADRKQGRLEARWMLQKAVVVSLLVMPYGL